MLRQRVRIRFGKEGELRMISHRDLLQALERLFRRVGVRLSMTEGFHPRPRLSFPLSLALGMRGLDEVFEVELDDPPPEKELLADFARQAPPGLLFHSLEFVPPGASRLAVAAADYEIEAPGQAAADVNRRIGDFLALASHVVSREHRDQTVDVRQAVASLSFDGTSLRMRLRTSNSAAAAKPQEVLAALGLEELLNEGRYFTRTGLVLAEPVAAPFEPTQPTES